MSREQEQNKLGIYFLNKRKTGVFLNRSYKYMINVDCASFI